jgi:hypothetical protein
LGPPITTYSPGLTDRDNPLITGLSPPSYAV